MIKTILFDVGATLYDNEIFDEQYSSQLTNLLMEEQKLSKEDAEALINTTTQELHQRSNKHITKVATMKELGFSRTKVHNAFCRNKPDELLRKDNRLVELLTTLSKQYTLGIVSNFRSSHTKEIVKALGLDAGIFSVIIGEEEVINIKPDPEGFIMAMKETNSLPQATVYVADSITKDLIPAKSVGLHTIQVSKKHKDSEAVDIRIDSIYELAEAVKCLSL